MEKKYTLQQILIFAGGLLGLIAGTVIGLRRFGVVLLFPDAASGLQPVPDPHPPSGDALIGQIAFLLVFTLPFALSLLALRSNRASVQSVIWVGGGLLALVGAYFSFSWITIALLPVPGILLLIGGGMAFFRPEVEKSLLVIVLALALVFSGATAFYTLFTQENPACWSLVRTESGEAVWEPSPPGTAPAIVVGDAEAGDVLSSSCSSDVISASEGLKSVGIWAAVLIAFFVVDRRTVLG